MPNTIPDSPITIKRGKAAFPDVPAAVEDAFGAAALVTLHRDRWRALLPRDGGHVFAWLESGKAMVTGVTTRVTTMAQTLESDSTHRALVIGGHGESLYAVEPTGAATCLGILPEGTRIEAACWLAGGGVAVVIGGDLCVYLPDAQQRLVPLVRFAAKAYPFGIRSLAHEAGVHVVALMVDDRGAIYAITPAGDVHVLADFERLSLADVRLTLDESGNNTQLLEGTLLSLDCTPAAVEGIAEAVAMLDRLPRAPRAAEPAPAFAPGPDLAALDPAAAQIDIPRTPLPTAAVAPSLDRLLPLTRALIKMLRAAPKHAVPREDLLRLIRESMPSDLRAYIHAWAVHDPNNPTVYEFWMAAPRSIPSKDALQLGSLASGEPILARYTAAGCEVIMIDEEGQPYRYRGLEGFLADLELRAEDAEFELDAWKD